VIRFLLDENVPLASAARVRLAGHDVVQAIARETDRALLERATAERRVIVTFDRDFGSSSSAAASHRHPAAAPASTWERALDQQLSALPDFEPYCNEKSKTSQRARGPRPASPHGRRRTPRAPLGGWGIISIQQNG
jgi:hypothetical protein